MTSLSRLGVRHLLLWGACSSVFYLLISAEERSESLRNMGFLALLLWSGACDGAIAAGAVVSLHARVRRKQRLLEHPARALLVLWAAALLLDSLPIGGLIPLPLWFGVAIEVGIEFYIAAKVRPLRWKAMFAITGILAILVSALPFVVTKWVPFPPATTFQVYLLQVQSLAPLATTATKFAMATVVLILDAQSRQSFDWLHWITLTIYAMDQGISLCFPSNAPFITFDGFRDAALGMLG